MKRIYRKYEIKKIKFSVSYFDIFELANANYLTAR